MNRLTVLILMALVLALAVGRRVGSQTSPADSPVRPPWTQEDLGLGAPGNSRAISATFKLTSSGAEISGTKDSCHFMHQRVTNDVSIVARILSIAGPGSAGGGLMIRSALNPAAPSVFLGLTASNGIAFHRRAEEGAITESDFYKAIPSARAQRSVPANARVWSESSTNSGPPLAIPCWLKLVRHGPDFSAWYSLNGTNWDWIGTERLHLPPEIQIGLATASGDPRQSCSVTFDQVQLQHSDLPAPVPAIGNGIGLLGTLTEQSGTNRHQRLNATVNFGWGRRNPAPGITNQYFNGTWEGFVEPQFTEPYTFSMVHDDDARLWIGDQLIIDDQGKPSVREARAVVVLSTGARHSIRIEYAQGHGPAVLKLRWSSPSTPTQIIPRSQLHPPAVLDALKTGPPAQPFDLSEGLEALQAIDQLAGLAVPWLTRSFRPGTNAGLAQSLGDTIAVTATGSLTGRGVDDGRFVYQPWRGDVQLIARVRQPDPDEAADSAAPAAKSGLMIRQTLEENSPTAFLALTPRGPARFFHRRIPGNQTQLLRPPSPRLVSDAPTAPHLGQPWIKLIRRGDTFAGYTSFDGIGWSLLGTVSIPMEADVFIGLAAGSGAANLSCEATFDAIQISPPPALTPLIGAGDGLAAAYFNEAGSNSVLQIDPQINFFWGNQPPAEGISTANFRVRWQGLLEAQFSDIYTLHLVNDGSVRVWFDGQPLLRGANGPRERERTVQLSLRAGHRYPIKLEYIHQQPVDAGSRSSPAMRLLWSCPGTSKSPIPQSQLYSTANPAYGAIPDQDRDQLPDHWENRHGLDPFDASDAAADPDNDSLTNLREFQAGTNPRHPDSDADGLPDAWEFRYHLNPLNPADAQGDADHDRLSNRDEFRAGTHPDNPDTDSDGLSDAIELNEMISNPLVSDTTRIQTIAEIPGANSVDQLGRWKAERQVITAVDGRGAVEYNFSAPKADIYRLEIEAGPGKSHDRNREFNLLLWVDGQYLGRSFLIANNGLGSSNPRGLTQVLTPWLHAGPHRLRVYWDNAVWDRSFQLAAIRLQSLEGPDSNNDGIKDWAEKRLQSTCDVNVAPSYSAVSPVCVEGKSKYLSLMTLSGETSPQATTLDHWYANVPLSPTETATLVCSFENDALRVTNRITWRPTNLLQSGPLIIRVGDALLLAALPEGAANGQATVRIEGVTNYVSPARQPVPHQFTEPGNFNVIATYSALSATLSATVSVAVVSASLGPPPAAWVGKWRPWQCAFSPQVILETDVALTLEPGRVGREQEYWLMTDEPETRSIVARLGTNGPVVAQTAVRGFRLYSGYETAVRRIETYQDGNELVEMGLVLSPMRPGLTVRIDLHVGGVLFEEGAIAKELSSANFNDLGQASVRFIRPATAKTSVCHRTRIYQGPILLGIYP